MVLGIDEAIRASAARKKMQLQTVAYALGITPTSLTRKMQKPRTIKLDELLRLADTLGWSDKTLSEILKDQRQIMKERKEI
jgi:plasmid maintenance system antidote protein VapI